MVKEIMVKEIMVKNGFKILVLLFSVKLPAYVFL